MWIFGTILLSVVCGYETRDVGPAVPFYCAYKDDKSGINVNASLKAEAEAIRNFFKGHLFRPGVFVENGFERCVDTKSPNNCYSLWGLDATTNKYDLIKQGCWDTDTCQEEACTTPSVTLNNPSTIKFCCCRGNKCNGDRQEVNIGKAIVQPGSGYVAEKPKTATNPTCAFKSKDTKVKGQMAADTGGIGQVLADGKTALCNRGDFCFSFYTMDPNKTETTVMYQGITADEGRKYMMKLRLDRRYREDVWT